MSRFPRFLILFLTLSLLFAACRPPTADRRPQADGGRLTVDGGQTGTPTPTFAPTLTATPTETPIPRPSLESLGLFAETQALLKRQGWDIAWDAQNARYLIRQRAFDEASQTFTSQKTHEVGYIDTEGNLHINIIHPSYQKIAENKYQDTSNPQELIVNLKNLSTPTPEAGQETQKPGFELLSTDNPNPLFQKTGGILVFRYLDENGVLRTATFSRKEAAFVDFDLSTASENLFVWTSEPEVLQTEFPVTHIPWELLHDPSLPVTARLIAEGFDRDFPEETKAALMGYILRFERADDGSKVCFLRPALRDQIPDPKNPQKTIKFEITDEFVDDAVRWAARKDKDGNWERLFFTTIDPKGNKILFTYMQILDINGNRLFLPLAIGVNVPDEKMAYFIKDWNTSEDRTPGGNFNSSFFRIIIATEGDYFKEFSPEDNHIFYRMMGPKSRDPLDSLLRMEGNDVRKMEWVEGTADLGVNSTTGLHDLSNERPLLEMAPFTIPLPFTLQQFVLVISP